MNSDIKFKYECAKDAAARFNNWKILDDFFEELMTNRPDSFSLKPSHMFTDYIDISTTEE